jgi:hypothetical protein
MRMKLGKATIMILVLLLSMTLMANLPTVNSLTRVQLDEPSTSFATGNQNSSSTTISLIVTKIPNVNEELLVNISIAGVAELFTWQVTVWYNPTTLNYVEALLPSDNVFAGMSSVGLLVYHYAEDHEVKMGNSLLGDPATTHFTGSGTLVQIKFVRTGEVTLADFNILGPFNEAPCSKTMLIKYPPPTYKETFIPFEVKKEKPIEIKYNIPSSISLNPSLFRFDRTIRVYLMNLGTVTIKSKGFEGNIKVKGSASGGVRLYVGGSAILEREYYLPKNGEVTVPILLGVTPGRYKDVSLKLELTICGTYKREITVNIKDIWACENGQMVRAGGTVTFRANITGGSRTYLLVDATLLPSGWSYNVDPPNGTLFETPYTMTLNITAPPDATEGDIGAITLSAFTETENILFWQFIYLAALDSTPPTIEAIQTPLHTPMGNLLFNVTFKDVGSGIADVQLFYSINDGPWNNHTMNWDNGDTFNSTSYTLLLPEIIPNNSTLNYYVVATDWLRNTRQSDIYTLRVIYDIAIKNIIPIKTVVGQNLTTPIDITIENEGTVVETSFEITLYANTTIAKTQVMSLLTNGTSIIMRFNWTTTGFAKGNYTLSAYAWPVPGETDTADNMLVDGIVTVAMIGDISSPTKPGVPDGKVDMADVGAVARLFSISYPDPKYNPNYDITGPVTGTADGKIDMMDIGTVARNFGKTDP